MATRHQPAGIRKNGYLMSQAAKQKPTGTKRRNEAEERLIAWLEKEEGRKLTEQEKNLAIAQAEIMGASKRRSPRSVRPKPLSSPEKPSRDS